MLGVYQMRRRAGIFVRRAFLPELKKLRERGKIVEESKTLPTLQLLRLGQSPWLDQIGRDLLRSGRLAQMLRDWGLTGVTTNPTIFDRAIRESSEYDDDIRRLASEGKSVLEIYDELITSDVREAADILRKVYDRTAGDDGYVSIEPSPELAYKTEETVEEVKRIAAKVARPNVLVKVPGTPEGVEAVRCLVAERHKINVTLVFSQKHFEAAAEAYIAGAEEFVGEGGEAEVLYSVASVFVSRLDTVADAALEALAEKANGAEESRRIRGLLGKVAVANAKMIYGGFRVMLRSPRYRALRQAGVRVQRVLWGSTSTKNPKYSDVKYVEELIGPDSVNTMPLATIEAFNDHGEARLSVGTGIEEAKATLERLSSLGLSLDEMCEDLQRKGVEAFEKSYEELVASIEKKTKSLA